MAAIKHISLAQLTTVVNAMATKNDARFLKKTDMGALATKDEVAFTDLASAVQDRITSLETTADGLGDLAVKDNVAYADLDASEGGLKSRFDTLETTAAGLGDLATKDEAGFDDLTEALQEKINAKAESEDVYLKTETYTKTEVDQKIAANISSAYKAAGTKAPTDLTAALLTEANLGNVYNINGAFTATSGLFVDSVEGNGFTAGTNVVVVEATPADNSDPENPVAATYKFDVLQGWVDLSNYATVDAVVASTDGAGGSNGLMIATDKEKLDNIVLAEDADITALVDSIYATTPDPEEPSTEPEGE